MIANETSVSTGPLAIFADFLAFCDVGATHNDPFDSRLFPWAPHLSPRIREEKGRGKGVGSGSGVFITHLAVREKDSRLNARGPMGRPSSSGSPSVRRQTNRITSPRTPHRRRRRRPFCRSGEAPGRRLAGRLRHRLAGPATPGPRPSRAPPAPAPRTRS